jgi:hypothetical protein
MTREEFSKQIEAINPKLAILFHCPVMFHFTARLELARKFDALLREARSEGAQVERAECAKLADSHEQVWERKKNWYAELAAKKIAQAIRERDGQSLAQAEGEKMRRKVESVVSILARDSFDLDRPKVSREIDCLILQRLFGAKRVFRPSETKTVNDGLFGGSEDYHFIPSGKPPRTHMIDAEIVPHFSKYIAHAWGIVEKLRLQEVWTKIEVRAYGGGYRVEMGRPSEQWEAFALSAPVAICVATVKFLIKEESNL